ncbi:helix-turn-helix domain-containing protein [Rosenbergiella epipactidis]|uniref:helix-turn-helix domain-containing protein n=1 Tax=Rosenbergiella epipactidis TaxID=1544694 RepID=UPI001F4FC6BB|nr:helix-turn-helix domain-containing protein [Rosenbergiella epipactidis]
MKCNKYIPYGDISPWLSLCLEWFFDKSDFIPEIFPGTGNEILFNLGDEMNVSVLKDNTTVSQTIIASGSAIIITPREYRVKFSSSRKIHFLTLRFKTAAFFDIFGIPVNLVKDCIISLNDLNIDYPNINNLLINKTETLGEWLRKKISVKKNNELILLEPIERFYHNCNYDLLFGSVVFNKRTLQRKIHHHVGVDIRSLQKNSRFQKAIKELFKGRPLLNTILDYGFYDQSHFIKNCVTYTSLSPKKLFTDQHITLNHYNVNTYIIAGYI